MHESHQKQCIGWREWLSLPDLKIPQIKAKVDTGARTSSLHAHNLEYFTKKKKTFVRFCVHPVQRSKRKSIETTAELKEERHVKSSGGHQTLRPVIETSIKIADQVWSIELTLIDRDLMGFRMLLGRQAIKNRFFVDPGRSYLIGKKRKK